MRARCSRSTRGAGRHGNPSGVWNLERCHVVVDWHLVVVVLCRDMVVKIVGWRGMAGTRSWGVFGHIYNFIWINYSNYGDLSTCYIAFVSFSRLFLSNVVSFQLSLTQNHVK